MYFMLIIYSFKHILMFFEHPIEWSDYIVGILKSKTFFCFIKYVNIYMYIVHLRHWV